MSKPNALQVAILASQLRTKGYESAENVPLEVWRSFGFLGIPSVKLQEAISQCLGERLISDDCDLS